MFSASCVVLKSLRVIVRGADRFLQSALALGTFRADEA